MWKRSTNLKTKEIMSRFRKMASWLEVGSSRYTASCSLKKMSHKLDMPNRIQKYIVARAPKRNATK